MTILQAIILGAVQGLTEFLPVSSSGHLVLFQEFFGFVKADLSFEIALHFATLLAIIIFFYKDILNLKKTEILLIMLATLPAVLVGLFLKNVVENVFSWPMLVSLALLVTGIFNLWIDHKVENKTQIASKKLNWRDALIMGLFQAVAIIPGISRSGSTLLGALNRGLDRKAAFRFSFLLAIPAIVGASVLQVWQQQKIGFSSIQFWPYFFGCLAAFLVGLTSLYLFKYVIEKAKFEYFAYYCFAAAFISFMMQVI